MAGARAGAGAGAGTAAGPETAEGMFTLLLFASASTYTGTESLTLPAPTTLRKLFATLESRFPGFTEKVLDSAAVTVNLEYVDFDPAGLRLGTEEGERGEGEGEGLDLVVLKGDEVGILPPVSSG